MLPSGFLTSTTGAAHGLSDALAVPVLSGCCTIVNRFNDSLLLWRFISPGYQLIFTHQRNFIHTGVGSESARLPTRIRDHNCVLSSLFGSTSMTTSRNSTPSSCDIHDLSITTQVQLHSGSTPSLRILLPPSHGLVHALAHLPHLSPAARFNLRNPGLSAPVSILACTSMPCGSVTLILALMPLLLRKWKKT
ncbi:hypothetical protein Pelo_4252 [Pelomyxa schiedti]|nr:hypothetical protein Pelo_4252 [Pelomyxa schiedti]